MPGSIGVFSFQGTTGLDDIKVQVVHAPVSCLLDIEVTKVTKIAVDNTVMDFPKVPEAGVWCPAVTFFDPETGALETDAQKAYFKYLSNTGITGLVVLGSNSEAFLLNRQERYQIIAAAREAVGPSFPLMAGVGGHSTQQTLEFAQDAKKAGAQYLLVLPPAYFGAAKSPETVVKAFYGAIAEANILPIIIYNFPGVCNGVDISAETITTLAKRYSNIVGVKLTCGSVSKITKLAASFRPSQFATYGGQADFLVSGLSVGSAGCIAAFVNVAPKLISQIYRLYREGRTAEALELNQSAAFAETTCKGDVAAVKFGAALSSARVAGISDAEQKLLPRHPYESVAPATQASIATALKAIELLEMGRRTRL